MTPQLHTFNSGIWLNLENKVREWGNACDTLYVVTGCVVGDNSIEGKRAEVGGYTLDNDKKKVAIPIAYYKAVLRYHKNSTYGYSGYSAVAFYLVHEPNSSSISKALALSVDELEEKTGLDFFVNLPSVIGQAAAEKVESEDPKGANYWW